MATRQSRQGRSGKNILELYTTIVKKLNIEFKITELLIIKGVDR